MIRETHIWASDYLTGIGPRAQMYIVIVPLEGTHPNYPSISQYFICPIYSDPIPNSVFTTSNNM